MINSQLLCTFVTKNTLQGIVSKIVVAYPIVFNKIYIITINTALFLFIINLINSYYYVENSFFKFSKTFL